MKAIRVKEVYRLYGKASITVPESVTLDYVVAMLGHEPRLQGVFMVDSNQRLVGMISRFDLLRWTQAHFCGGENQTDTRINDFIRLLNARKVKDIETDNTGSFSVKENDTIQAALDLMIRYGKDIIPVLDGEGRVIGDLSLSELLSKALESGMQPQPEP